MTILGAHSDSINTHGRAHDSNEAKVSAPGADDNASGTAVLLEVLRVLVAAKYQPSTSVEFHWYAGEEPGLLGSLTVAKKFHEEQMQVRAMLQLDSVA